MLSTRMACDVHATGALVSTHRTVSIVDFRAHKASQFVCLTGLGGCSDLWPIQKRYAVLRFRFGLKLIGVSWWWLATPRCEHPFSGGSLCCVVARSWCHMIDGTGLLVKMSHEGSP